MERLTAKRMQQRLGEVDGDFKRLHFTIVDLLEQQEDLELKQAIFDEHEDRIDELGDRLQQLILRDESAKGELTAPLKGLETSTEPSRLLRRRLNHIESTLRSVNSTVESLTSGPDLDTCCYGTRTFIMNIKMWLN